MKVIYIKEKQKDTEIEPIEWILATNDSVSSLEEAHEKIKYYAQRWKIERFRGRAIEKIQERSVDKTIALILMYSIIAVLS